MTHPTQQALPGTAAAIAGPKLHDVLLQTGRQMALEQLYGELKAAQKQHPAAVGLTLALALVERDKATATLASQRIVLGAAAKAGLDFDGQVLVSGLEGDALVVRVQPEPPEAS